MPPIGLVEGPSDRRLRIGLVLDSITDTPTDDETRSAVQDTALLLEKLGHTVVEVPTAVAEKFIADFTHYWSLLAFSTHHFGSRVIGPGLRQVAHRSPDPLPGPSLRAPGVAHPVGLAAVSSAARPVYRRAFAETGVDVVLSPTLGHTTPRLGYLSPNVEFPEMFDRLVRYAAFTPLQQRRRRTRRSRFRWAPRRRDCRSASTSRPCTATSAPCSRSPTSSRTPAPSRGSRTSWRSAGGRWGRRTVSRRRARPAPRRSHVAHGADPGPAVGQVGRRAERGDQRVVVAAGEHEPDRVGAERVGDGGDGLRDRERRRLEVDDDSAGEGDVPDVGEQAVADVDHRGGSGVGGLRSRRVRRLRDPVRVDGGLGRAESAAQCREARHRPARARRRTRRRRRAPRRRDAPDASASPIAVTAMTIWSAAVTSPPTTWAPTSAHSASKPSASSRTQRGRQVRRQAERDREGGGDAAHRVDVGQVGRGRLAPDLRGGRPVAAEVPTLDQQVGGDDERAVAGLDLGGVVAGTDERLAVRAGALTHEIDQRELADLTDGPLICFHGSIIAQARGRPTDTVR